MGSAALDHELAANIHAKIRQAVEQAHDRCRPIRLRSAVGEVPGIGGDRNRPERSVDTRVSILAFEGEQGDPEAILFHYACHPTVLSADNLDYSADFPGAARQRIRERYPNAVCLFVNGAAGNISTRFYRHDQSFGEVERLGRLLGERVDRTRGRVFSRTPCAAGRTASRRAAAARVPGEARQVEIVRQCAHRHGQGTGGSD